MNRSHAADVIVIGAGIIGAACAQALARRGLQVLVLDAGLHGATAAGMGHLLVLDDNPAELALSNYSLQRWREQAADLPEGCAYRSNGTLWLAANAEEMAVAHSKYLNLQAHGVACELVGAKALRQREPELHEGLEGGLLINGDGFSNMRFAFHGLDQAGFDQWVSGVRQGGQALGRDEYLELEKPSEKVPVMHFGAVDVALWDAILNMCVEPGKMCMAEMMEIDDRGGLSMASIRNTMPLVYDKYAGRGKSQAYFGSNESYVMTICTPLQAEAAAAERVRQAELDTAVGPVSLERLTGQGLSPKRTPMASLTPLAPNPFATGPVSTDVRSVPNA